MTLSNGPLGIDCLSFPSENQEPRPAPVVCGIVLHSFGYDIDTALRMLGKSVSNHGLGVSAHYLVAPVPGWQLESLSKIDVRSSLRYPDKVPVFELVSPERMAYHAGQSSWRDWNTRFTGCEKGLNGITIGIEICSPGAGLDGNQDNIQKFSPYSQAQCETLQVLINWLLKQYQLERDAILTHADIAPDRKTDPGPWFPYHLFQSSRLTRIGKKIPKNWKEVLELLLSYGYCVSLEEPQNFRNRLIFERFCYKMNVFPTNLNLAPITDWKCFEQEALNIVNNFWEIIS